MPKIFSNIAKSEQGLQNIYNKSTINENSSTLIVIRDLAKPNTALDVNIASTGIRRIEPMYNLYSNKQSLYTQAILKFPGNGLNTATEILKKGRLIDSTLYDRFSSTNWYMQEYLGVLPNNGTLIEIKPYSTDVADESTMLQDSRKLPIVSGPRDEKRMFKLLANFDGVKFLLQQQLLQSANTFKQSRRYNPLSVSLAVSNYARASLTNPLERVNRMLSTDMLPSNASVPNMRMLSEISGRLQQETVLTKQAQFKSIYIGGQQGGSNRNTFLGQVVGTVVNRLAQNILNRTNITIFGRRVNLGQLGRQINQIAQTAQSIIRGIDNRNPTLEKDQTAYDAMYDAEVWPLVKEQDGVQNFHRRKQNYIKRAQQSVDSAKLQGKLHNNFFTKPYPSIEEDYRGSTTYTDDTRTEVGLVNGITSGKYMKDPMNYNRSRKAVSVASELDNLHGDVDFIKFKIIVPTVYDLGISFRAFIQDLKHSSKGDYEEQRYVGRPERFIVYKGMNRSTTFTLYLVAFSKEELSAVWTRANVLNKLVYPIDNAGGYMIPPIIKLTLGDIFQDQPGYVTDVNMDFADMPWDIDLELTQVIKVNITFNIIEKNLITQSQLGNAKNGLELFANTMLAAGQLDIDSINTSFDGLNLPQINLNPTVDPLSPELLRRDLQETGRSFAYRMSNQMIDEVIKRNNR
jgi:hypothetical protein